MVEQLIRNQQVDGSSPFAGSILDSVLTGAARSGKRLEFYAPSVVRRSAVETLASCTLSNRVGFRASRNLEGVTPKSATELRVEAERLVTAAADDRPVSPGDRADLVDAVAADLAAHDRTVILESRLLKLEFQVETLSNVVAALTDALAPSDPSGAMRQCLSNGPARSVTRQSGADSPVNRDPRL